MILGAENCAKRAVGIKCNAGDGPSKSGIWLSVSAGPLGYEGDPLFAGDSWVGVDESSAGVRYSAYAEQKHTSNTLINDFNLIAGHTYLFTVINVPLIYIRLSVVILRPVHVPTRLAIMLILSCWTGVFSRQKRSRRRTIPPPAPGPDAWLSPVPHEPSPLSEDQRYAHLSNDVSDDRSELMILTPSSVGSFSKLQRRRAGPFQITTLKRMVEKTQKNAIIPKSLSRRVSVCVSKLSKTGGTLASLRSPYPPKREGKMVKRGPRFADKHS